MFPFYTEQDPNAQPPESIRFESIIITPYIESKRVRIQIEITPFLEKPNLEIELFNSDKIIVASMSLVELLEHKFELTLHIKEDLNPDEYLLQANIYYADLSHYEIKEDQEPKPAGKPAINIVDKLERNFSFNI